MAEYSNKLKYERAKAESNITGEPIEAIYLKFGGKIIGEVQVSVPRETEKESVVSKVKKAVKKAANKK